MLEAGLFSNAKIQSQEMESQDKIAGYENRIRTMKMR